MNFESVSVADVAPDAPAWMCNKLKGAVVPMPTAQAKFAPQTPHNGPLMLVVRAELHPHRITAG